MGYKTSHGVSCHEFQNIFLFFELFFQQSTMQDPAPFVNYRIGKVSTGTVFVAPSGGSQWLAYAGEFLCVDEDVLS